MSVQAVKADIENIGRDVRDNCNNRLQEILAMASAAHASPDTVGREEAYSRIVSAVQGIAGDVNSLEDRLLSVVATGQIR